MTLTLDASGTVPVQVTPTSHQNVGWIDLAPFTQGYVEAALSGPIEHPTYNRANYPVFVVNHGSWDIMEDGEGHCAAIPTPEAQANGCKATQFGDRKYVRVTLGV